MSKKEELQEDNFSPSDDLINNGGNISDEVDEVRSDDKKNKKSRLNDKLKKLEEEKNDLEGRLKRALADYHNLSKNIAQEKADFIRYSLQDFFLEILPIYQNLRMAINSLGEKERDNPWVEGVKYVIKQFQDVFRNNGLEEIKTVGEKFDYNLMEAIEGNGEIVVKEVNPGYKLKGKVIMPARVVLENGDDDI